MKGIAHFITGVAVATFFPEIVHSAAADLTFGPVLGGIAGLLPDTLDFKFVRYFERLDDEIDPARITRADGQPDPQAIAGRIAAAMNRAYAENRPVKVHLHTVRLGADLWRQWSVAFDLERHQVVVRIGPVVTTGQVPFAGSEVPGLGEGRAQVAAPIRHTYDAETRIDIFSGPSLAFERVPGGGESAPAGQVSNLSNRETESGEDVIEVTFLPWHRAWSHSLFLALLLGAVGWLIAPVYGAVMALAVLAHIAEDQLGFMGSNLFFPFTRKRTLGLKLLRSGDAIPNFLTVWASLAVILLNLDRFSPSPLIPLWPYILGVIVAPGLLLVGGNALLNRLSRRPPPRRLSPQATAAVEALDETVQVEI